MLASSVQAFSGWSIGYQYAVSKKAEEEVKQGKNYYLCALNQISQGFLVQSPLSNAFSYLPNSSYRSVAMVAAGIFPLINIPFSLLCATVRLGNYSWVPFLSKIGVVTRSFLNFMAEHQGNIWMVALAVSSVVLAYFGSLAFTAGIFAGLVYKVLDETTFVPLKVSLWMQRHMSVISLIGCMLAPGSIFIKLYGIVGTTTHLLPQVSKFFTYKVHNFAIKWLRVLAGPSLEELDAPVVLQKNLSFLQINQILQASPQEFELNPAHLSKTVLNTGSLPQDFEFEKFNGLFESIAWEKLYHVVVNKLKADDRFLDLLNEQVQHIHDRKKMIQEFDQHLQTWISKSVDAQGKALTREQWTAKWVKEQMRALVDVLTGKKKAKGNPQDVAAAIPLYAKILSYIQKIPDDCHVEREDLLLGIAIEAGDYCALAIKRSATESVEYIAATALNDPTLQDVTSCEYYETKLNFELLKIRQGLAQNTYIQVMKQTFGDNEFLQDNHLHDEVGGHICLGFCPVSSKMRDSVNGPSLLVWSLYDAARRGLYETYRNHVYDAFKAVGKINFASYLKMIIDENSSLSIVEKEMLMESYLEPVKKYASSVAKERMYERLILAMMGVLKFTKDLNET